MPGAIVHAHFGPTPDEDNHMNRMLTALLPALLLSMTACSGHPEQVAVDPLGITSFDVQQTATELHIIGLDAQRAQVAELLLSVGRVVLPEENLDGDGKKLSVQVMGAQVEHESVGTAPVVLPFLDDKNLVAFLVNPHVAPLVAKWGITFVDPATTAATTSADERPLAACTHATSASCVATGCCEDSGAYEDVCCSGPKAMVKRSCSSSATSACGTNGPLGCAVCWSAKYTSTCSTATKGLGCTYTIDSICTCDSATCNTGYSCESNDPSTGRCMCICTTC